ncbi:MAG: hypothetical protein QW567_01845 [Candidatus Hadarchaeales archaeon]
MKKIAVGGGEISVSPLAFESLGVRGMSTLVETRDISVLIDPGSALGPRFNLMPHEREYAALSESRERMLEAAGSADLITVSHYHFDHYVPGFEEWTWIWSSPEIAERIYRGKRMLVKDIRSEINISQRKRGFMFQKFVTSLAQDIEPADGREFRFGGTLLRFSPPASHGPPGTQLGRVLMVSIRCGETTFLHASDVQGPIDRAALDFILREKPDMAVIGGPPLYLRGFRVGEEELGSAIENMKVLARTIPLIVIDHHLLRTEEYVDYMGPVVKEARSHDHTITTASEMVGKRPALLEANRKQLYAREPMESGSMKHIRELMIRLGATSSQERVSPEGP